MIAGCKTSSFWISAVSSVVGLLVLSGVMTSEEGDSLSKAIQAAAGAVVSIATTLGYIITRLQLKQSVVDATTAIVGNAQPPVPTAQVMSATTHASPSSSSSSSPSPAAELHAALNNAGV